MPHYKRGESMRPTQFGPGGSSDAEISAAITAKVAEVEGFITQNNAKLQDLRVQNEAKVMMINSLNEFWGNIKGAVEEIKGKIDAKPGTPGTPTTPSTGGLNLAGLFGQLDGFLSGGQQIFDLLGKLPKIG